MPPSSPLCHLGKGAQTKNRKKCGLLPNRGGGGGVSEGRKMPNLYFGVLKRAKNGQKTHWNFIFFIKMPNRGGVRGGFGKRPDFFRFLFCAPFPNKNGGGLAKRLPLSTARSSKRERAQPLNTFFLDREYKWLWQHLVCFKLYYRCWRNRKVRAAKFRV